MISQIYLYEEYLRLLSEMQYRKIEFPTKDEYPEYANMYMRWISQDGNLLKHLEDNLNQVLNFIKELNPQQLLHRYQEDKWSIKEILVHIVDDERIYAYRALRFARNDKTDLPGFDQDYFTRYSGADDRDIDNIISEYKQVRYATIAMYNGFSEHHLERIGTADNNSVSVRALGYHIAGHEMHHFNIIKVKYIQGIHGS